MSFPLHSPITITQINSSHRQLNKRFHKTIFYIIPLLLTFRLIVLNTKNLQKLPEPLKLFSSNCNFEKPESPPPPLPPSPPTKPIATTEDAQKDKSSLELILHSIQSSHAHLLRRNEQHQGVVSVHDVASRTTHYIQPRAFPRRNVTFPCFKPEKNWKIYNTAQRKPAHRGFFYVKTYKTASTTVMGVAIRIAMKAAERYNQRHRDANFETCKVRFEHWPAYRLDYQNRKRSSSFLFAVLREPTQRAISMFFHFEVSRERKQPLDANFKRFLTYTPKPNRTHLDYYPWAVSNDHYLHYLSVDGYHPGSETNSTKRRIRTVNKILADYDFIGITERLDESLVALQLILGLKTSDILYYSAKGNGSWDDKGIYIQPSFVSKGMENFFASDTWKERSKGDYLMYMAANASLDRTIDALGRRAFEKKLALFQYAKKLVTTNCTSIRPLYSERGQAWGTDCLLADAGCGSRCFDKLERDFEL